MDLDELRSVRRTERQKDSLQHLRDSFYEDVAAYIEGRKAERRRTAEAADDPYGNPEVRRLTDEIETAEDVVEAIYERRVGKVVKLASFAAADMSADKSGLTAEERDLFDDLVERIKRNRRTILDTLAGEDDATDAPTPGGADPDPAGDPHPPEADAREAPAADAADHAADRATPADDPPAPDDVLAAAMGGDDAASDATPETATGSPTAAEGSPTPPPDPGPDSDPERHPAASAANGAETDGGDPAGAAGSVADSPAPSGTPPRDDGVGTDAAPDPAGPGTEADPDSDRVTLRITADVGRIYGVDEREYDLESEDVVRLPATNAGPLVDRGAAERLE
jgi:DNA replication factor GINS